MRRFFLAALVLSALASVATGCAASAPVEGMWCTHANDPTRDYFPCFESERECREWRGESNPNYGPCFLAPQTR
jgi:hypothetical protein